MICDMLLIYFGILIGYIYHSFKYRKELEIKKRALTREIKIWQRRNGRIVDGL